MERSILFVITLLAVCSLAAYVARRMFDVPGMTKYEMSKMYFAAGVLAFLAFIFMLSIIVYAFGPEPINQSADSPGKIIFDACIKILPPLVTLIIGFYFGATQQSNQHLRRDGLAEGTGDPKPDGSGSKARKEGGERVDQPEI